MGGESLYRFANSVQTWTDVFGLSGIPIFGISDIAARNLENQFQAEQGKYIEAQRKAARQAEIDAAKTSKLMTCFNNGYSIPNPAKQAKCQRELFQAQKSDITVMTGGMLVTGTAAGAVAGGVAAAGGGTALLSQAPNAVRGVKAVGNVVKNSSLVQTWTSLSAVKKSVGISAAVSSTTQIMQNGRVNACAFGVDMVTGAAGSGLTKLGSQAGLSVGSGAMSDYMCQGKSITETLKGVPGNALGTAAGFGVGKTGVGDISQTLTNEITKQSINTGMDKVVPSKKP